jgi:predicted metal-dependent enzyme (double-stranded beta helix superfamily)
MTVPTALRDPIDAHALLHEHAEWLRCNADRLPRAESGHSRTLLVGAPSFEIVAMRWAPGAVTPIHDHGDSRCATLLVEGTLAVEHFLRTDFAHAATATIVASDAVRLRPGDMESLTDRSELHRVRTVGAEPALALHLYASPLRGYHSFDERDGRVASHRSDYDLILAR